MGFERVHLPQEVQVKSTYTHTRENKEENGPLRDQDLGRNVAGEGNLSEKLLIGSLENSIES